MEYKIIELLNNKMNSSLKIEEIASILGVSKEDIIEIIKYFEKNGNQEWNI